MSLNQVCFPNKNLNHFTYKRDGEPNTTNRENAHKQRRASAFDRISRDLCAKNKHEQQAHGTDKEIVQCRPKWPNRNARRGDENRNDKFDVEDGCAIGAGEDRLGERCQDGEEDEDTDVDERSDEAVFQFERPDDAGECSTEREVELRRNDGEERFSGCERR